MDLLKRLQEVSVFQSPKGDEPRVVRKEKKVKKQIRQAHGVPPSFIEHDGVYYRRDQCHVVNGKLVPKEPMKIKREVDPATGVEVRTTYEL